MNKFGFTIIRKNKYDFDWDCAFIPDKIEYDASPGKKAKLLSHIENIWSNYGSGEAYWSVLTDKKYLNKNRNQKHLNMFYETGKSNVLIIENTLRRCGVWEELNKKDCLEYGCGIGRVTIHLANLFRNITALDISKGHLDLARQKINKLNIKNVNLRKIETFDDLKQLPKYDFIFTVIVLQHNPPPIIAAIIETLFLLLKTNGIVMFQVPVQKKGYRFIVDDYLTQMNQNKTMEMHVIPQPIVLGIARQCNCFLLEVHNDGCTGNEHEYVSQTFVFKKSD
jgi:2-polyprenyl-3-methyl-5-hydroxy-6-metoxy-1,4-benzoquinol methylase